jgi:hypothetical protein
MLSRREKEAAMTSTPVYPIIKAGIHVASSTFDRFFDDPEVKSPTPGDWNRASRALALAFFGHVFPHSNFVGRRLVYVRRLIGTRRRGRSAGSEGGIDE